MALVDAVTELCVPDDALLNTYRGGAHPERWGHYADCFALRVDRAVTLGAFTLAFYMSPLFRVERLILRLLAGAPSTDEQIRALAEGRATALAVWTVAERHDDQLLMEDRYGKTRSWFRVLQFGSAVAAARSAAGAAAMGGRFRALLRFHRWYSRALLAAAARKLAGSNG
jgi:hypothetical protein